MMQPRREPRHVSLHGNRQLIFDFHEGYLDPDFKHVVEDLRRKFEQAPGASGLLEVEKVYAIKNDALASEYKLAVKKLHTRASDDEFPKAAWQDEDLPARLKHNREVVLDDLKRISEPELGVVLRATVYHGCAKKDSKLICKTSFAANVQRTKGWFGEGVYTTTEPLYALRYALGFMDFWEAPPCVLGTVIVAQAAFASVYPVTRADYTQDPFQCDLKGERLKYGCDAHVASVRRTAPHGDERRWTYHACESEERAEARELVIQQESHLLPQFVVEVRVLDNPARRREMKAVFEPEEPTEQACSRKPLEPKNDVGSQEQPREQPTRACFGKPLGPKNDVGRQEGPREQPTKAFFSKPLEPKNDAGFQERPRERPTRASDLGLDQTPTHSTSTRGGNGESDGGVARPRASQPLQRMTSTSGVGASQVRSGTGRVLQGIAALQGPGGLDQYHRDARQLSAAASAAKGNTDLPSDDAIQNALRNAQRPLTAKGDTDLPSDDAIQNALRNTQRPLTVREVYLLAKGRDPKRDQMGSGVKAAMNVCLYNLKAAGQVVCKGDGLWEVK